MKYAYKSYREVLQQFAIACHTDDDEFWQDVGISAFFDYPNRSCTDRLKSTCQYLSPEYFEIFENYSGIIIGEFYFFSSKNISEEDFIDSNISTYWCIGGYKNTGRVYIAKSASVWYLNKADDSSAKEIANSFTEFMDECVFGERYLEFNGGNENDNAYRFIKIFRESNEKDYAKMSKEERLQICQNLNEQEAEIRRLMQEQEKPMNRTMGFVKNMFHKG